MRKDSWTPEDDSLLAKTVLDVIRAGKTQLQAFEEVEKVIGRTSAACGFRWNSEVRKSYEEELKQAKIDGKTNRKQGFESNESSISVETQNVGKLTVEADIFDTLLHVAQEAVATVRAIQKDNEKLQKENTRLKKKLEEKPNSEDLNTLTQLLNKARELGLLTDKNPAM